MGPWPAYILSAAALGLFLFLALAAAARRIAPADLEDQRHALLDPRPALGRRLARPPVEQHAQRLAQRLLRAPWPRAGSQAMDSQLVIQFVEQHLLEPFAARGALSRALASA